MRKLAYLIALLPALAFAINPTVPAAGSSGPPQTLVKNDGTTVYVSQDGTTTSIAEPLNVAGDLKFTTSAANIRDLDGAVHINFGSTSGNLYKSAISTAASSSSDHVFGTAISRTAGKLMEWDNNAALKAYFDYQGWLYVAGGVSPITNGENLGFTGNVWGALYTQGGIADGANISRFWDSSGSSNIYKDGVSTASSSTVAHDFQTDVSRTTAGTVIAQFDNLTTPVLQIKKDGSVVPASGAGALGSSGNYWSQLYAGNLNATTLVINGNTFGAYAVAQNLTFSNSQGATTTTPAWDFGAGNPRTTAGAILMSIDNSAPVTGAPTTPVFQVDKDGETKMKTNASPPQTCSSALEGFEFIKAGSGGTKTKKCLCTYDGTTAAWQDEISGTVGTTTSC